MTFLAALRKELLELWRTSRLVVLAAVLAFFGLTSPLLARYTPELIKLIPEGEAIAEAFPEPTVLDAVTQYTKNLGQFGVLLALLLTMGAVAQEKDRGTAALMLVKPLPRGTFLLAKFAALALAFTAAIAVAAAGCYYYTTVLFEPLDLPGWLGLNGLLVAYVLVYIALTLFCSVTTRSQAAAGGLALGLLFLLGLIGAIPGLGRYLPGQLLAWGGGLVIGGAETAWPALWVSAGIVVASLAGAWFVFERQEL
jgi:ABC-2 type transport system permease protein